MGCRSSEGINVYLLISPTSTDMSFRNLVLDYAHYRPYVLKLNDLTWHASLSVCWLWGEKKSWRPPYLPDLTASSPTSGNGSLHLYWKFSSKCLLSRHRSNETFPHLHFEVHQQPPIQNRMNSFWDASEISSSACDSFTIIQKYNKNQKDGKKERKEEGAGLENYVQSW